MEAADRESLKIEKGICGKVLPSGLCEQVRGRCAFHAQDVARCTSTIDSNPSKQCKLRKANGADVCSYHHDYPNLSSNLLAYLDEIGGMAPSADCLKEQLETFFGRFYPEKLDVYRPDLIPFFRWYGRRSRAY